MTTPPRKLPKGTAPANAIQKATSPPAPPLAAPDGWRQQTPFGFMKSDDTPAGRLVRLADVLRWLESSKELPRAAALPALCDAMPVNVLQWCYQLHQTEYARPLPSDCMFGFHTSGQVATATATRGKAALLGARHSNWVNTWGDKASTFRIVSRRISTAAPEPTEPGLPALVKLLRHWWRVGKLRGDSTCDVLDDPKAALPNSLAIRLDKAGELWGYGLAVQSIPADAQPSNWPELVAYRKRNPGGPWTPDMVELLAAAKAARGTGAAAALAGELGISITAVNAALKRPRKRQQASTASRVFSIGK